MNKEKIYDEQIAPLMAQVIAKAQAAGIGMVASFAIPTPENQDLACTTLVPSDKATDADQRMQAFGVWMAQDDSRLLRKQLAMGSALAVMTVMVDKKPEGQG